MAQPSRKKLKVFAPNVTNFPTVKAAANLDSLLIKADHESGATTLSLQQFADGTLDKSAHPLIKNRFTGRPILIGQLSHHIQSLYGDKKETTARNIIPILRRWWVFFDSIHHEQPVARIEDIDDFIGFKQVLERGLADQYRTDFLRLVNLARADSGLPQLYWPSQDEDRPAGSLPHFPHVKVIYHALKHHMKLVLARWELADTLAKSGTDWSGGLSARHSKIHGYWTDGETHATYRGAIDRLSCPSPTRKQVAALLQRPTVKAVHNVAFALEGLYPRKIDVQYILYLFILRTGWNATTALEVDVESCIIEHPTSSEHHVVRSFKNRGETEQIAIGMNKSQFSPGSILRVLIARTAPIRKHLKAELDKLEKTIDLGEQNFDLERVRLLRRMVKSPWLYCNRDGEITFLKSDNYLATVQGNMKSSGLKLIIKKLNLTRPYSDQIDSEMSVGDFRDAYIAFAYESSGYSWLVAKLAAGHSSLESLRTYLRKRQFKAYGESKVHAWSESLWSEIKLHRTVDPAILHARVQRGEISDEERARWARRTHVGTGCRDFRHPPKYISPEHKAGDGCRVQRCTLCEHAILFDDSCNHLARRSVELEHIQRTIPLLTWMQSSFAVEVENVELALGQFDSLVVAERKRFWEEEINSGRYLPLAFEGSY